MANCDITSHSTEHTVVQLRCSIRRTDIEVWIDKVTSSVPNGGLPSIAPKARYNMYGVHRWHRSPRGVNNGSQHLTRMNQHPTSHIPHPTYHMSHLTSTSYILYTHTHTVRRIQVYICGTHCASARLQPNLTYYMRHGIGIAMQDIIVYGIYIKSVDSAICFRSEWWTTHKSVDKSILLFWMIWLAKTRSQRWYDRPD